MVPLNAYLILAASIFAIGLIGFMTRRSIIMMLLCVELMLNAVNITLISLSHYMQDFMGQVIALLIIANAGAGMATGLALLINAYRLKKTVKIDLFKDMRG
ncbi:MAG TPA: NADH-quinone oxidoreductase subunit NuoK [Thermodesulfobium narugense]|uniref:NADH-quinone oxidoreductase subunit K n=1 Tax=Thermodesulfobium acidiphilum TaxID=1794699 RepID=A0A2R4W2I7_THEAF|nr:NADH-quinone oxidoreductase subunit NuoK [Thermodesulfobium acidiphilum]AWB11041.1 NADH-quinone oxidoreductase subunit K [Thermodesulfobium acidiphilum]HEM55938.1 NADH-quinone oxidoreductase subunit NuoK [Thermodesulfobium narugense]